jgi:O-antigen ligase
MVADNAYLSALIETGIIGLLGLVAVHIAVLSMAWRARASIDPLASLCGTWVFCFWIGEMVQMFSGDLLTYWRVIPLYFWVLALGVRYTYGKQAE